MILLNILAFESSCDETAAAVVKDGRTVLSSVIASSADMHAIYGGVVPEIASRKHVEAIVGLTDEALRAGRHDQAGHRRRGGDLRPRPYRRTAGGGVPSPSR